MISKFPYGLYIREPFYYYMSNEDDGWVTIFADEDRNRRYDVSPYSAGIYISSGSVQKGTKTFFAVVNGIKEGFGFSIKDINNLLGEGALVPLGKVEIELSEILRI